MKYVNDRIAVSSDGFEHIVITKTEVKDDIFIVSMGYTVDKDTDYSYTKQLGDWKCRIRHIESCKSYAELKDVYDSFIDRYKMFNNIFAHCYDVSLFFTDFKELLYLNGIKVYGGEVYD